jgi:hypothetical protein
MAWQPSSVSPKIHHELQAIGKKRSFRNEIIIDVTSGRRGKALLTCEKLSIKAKNKAKKQKSKRHVTNTTQKQSLKLNHLSLAVAE